MIAPYRYSLDSLARHPSCEGVLSRYQRNSEPFESHMLQEHAAIMQGTKPVSNDSFCLACGTGRSNGKRGLGIYSHNIFSVMWLISWCVHQTLYLLRLAERVLYNSFQPFLGRHKKPSYQVYRFRFVWFLWDKLRQKIINSVIAHPNLQLSYCSRSLFPG
jgi:hypothetical protein